MGAMALVVQRSPKSVVTVHDLGALLCPEDRATANAVDRFLLGLSLRGMRRAHRVIAVSEATKRDLVNVLGYPPKKVDAIPLGVDTEIFRATPVARPHLADRLRISIEDDTRVLLYVGSEQPRKGLETLVEALAILRTRGHRFQLIKVGSAGTVNERSRLLSKISALNLGDCITFLDYVDEHDLVFLYNCADVYVHPSCWEGFGLPALEAMACGTPVVSTNAGALPEVIGDAGLLVEPRDSDALAHGIESVLENPQLLKNLSERGVRRAHTFTWRQTARLTAETYDHVSNEIGLQRTGVVHDQLV
jgi:glycosyltransferase involved in cell wall biosynthesis